MKLCLFLLLMITGQALAYNKVKLEGKIYIPKGFDDNDSIEITTVGVSCKEVSTPYFGTIKFGMMEAGEYQVTLVTNQSTEVKKLSVSVAASSLVDDYNYGQVTGLIEDKETREITLIGESRGFSFNLCLFANQSGLKGLLPGQACLVKEVDNFMFFMNVSEWQGSMPG